MQRFNHLGYEIYKSIDLYFIRKGTELICSSKTLKGAKHKVTYEYWRKKRCQQ